MPLKRRLRSFFAKKAAMAYSSKGALRVAVQPELVPSRDAKNLETVEVRGKTVLKSGTEHALCQLVLTCYALHLVPRISPDDIWLCILCYFSRHVNEQTAFYRPLLADKNNPDGRTPITIIRDSNFDFNDTEAVQSVFNEFIAEVNKKSAATDLLPKLTSDFSTTTPLLQLCSEITLAYMVEQFFEMRMELLCGFPGIEFTGTKTDWESIVLKIGALAPIAHPEIQKYLAECASGVDNIVEAFNGVAEQAKWKDFFWSQSCGSGSTQYGGWFLNFFNEPSKADEDWSPRDMKSTRTIYEFKLNGAEVAIDAGPIGVVIADDGALELDYDYVLGPATARGWTLDGEKIWSEPNLVTWTSEPGIYDRVAYCGKKLHEFFPEVVARAEDPMTLIMIAYHAGDWDSDSGITFIRRNETDKQYIGSVVSFAKSTAFSQWSIRPNAVQLAKLGLLFADDPSVAEVAELIKKRKHEGIDTWTVLYKHI